MSTFDALGLIFIGIGIGFALTKGWQLHKSIKEQVRRETKIRKYENSIPF